MVKAMPAVDRDEKKKLVLVTDYSYEKNQKVTKTEKNKCDGKEK